MRTEDGLSPDIRIKRGVRQGCVLSSCLFNLYTENIFGAMHTNKGIRICGKTINNLRYADDTVLLAESESHWESVVTFDTKINAKKTKTMSVSKDVTLTKVSLKIDGDIIKHTDN